MSLALSNLALQSTTPASGGEWIDPKTAAKRSGQSEGNIKRNCGNRWFAAGLAKLERRPGGGKPAWMVCVSADPSFAKVKFPEQIEFDVRRLSGDQRRELNLRMEILNLWEIMLPTARAKGFTTAQIKEQFCSRMEAERGIRLCPKTLYNWITGYRSEGIAGLVDGRWIKTGSGGCDDDGDGESPFYQTLKNYYLTRRELSIRICWEMAKTKAEENGWRSVGLRAAGLYLGKIPVAVRVKARKGDDTYTTKCEPSIERDYTTLHSNEQWVGDHHQFDVICQSAGVQCRPWLTAWMDMRSRMIVGWCVYAHDPNSNAILSALRGGILAHGVCELLYVDNGKDYGSYVFHGSTKWQRRKGKVQLESGRVAGILNHLETKAKFCLAYHGQSKPIERFFNTVEARFCRGFETNCGRSPLHRPGGLEDRLARGLAPQTTDFAGLFGEWVETYNRSAHRGNGMGGHSPMEIFNSSWNGYSKRTASPELLETLLTLQTKDIVVHKNGVTYKGLHYGQYDPALIEWLGRKVYLRIDERDVTRVSVWSPDDRFICLAESNQRLPANAGHELLGAAIAEKKRHRKVVRQFNVARPRLHEDLPTTMIHAAAKQCAPALPAPAAEQPNLLPVRSAFESEASKEQIARESAAARRDPKKRESCKFEFHPTFRDPDEDEFADSPSTLSVMSQYQERRAGA